jgi:hypothetical protein
MILGWNLVLCSLLTSMTTVFCIMPFDNIKTYLQKNNLEAKDGVRIEKNRGQLTIMNAVKDIYKKAGPIGFFTGWRIKLCVNFINSSFTVCLLEWLDSLAKQAYDDEAPEFQYAKIKTDTIALSDNSI